MDDWIKENNRQLAEQRIPFAPRLTAPNEYQKHCAVCFSWGADVMVLRVGSDTSVSLCRRHRQQVAELLLGGERGGDT